MTVTGMLLARVEVDGALCDVRIRGTHVTEVGVRLRSQAGEEVHDARGGALLPGLHDHHIHLLALAARAGSVDCGPPSITSLDSLAAALRSAGRDLPPGGWLRGTGYAESVAGLPDRHLLDRLVPDRPVRIQHRGGALWILNSRALHAVAPALDDSSDVERDAAGAPTGRLWRYDARLRPALPTAPPDLGPVGARLASYGITGVTDATPDLDTGALKLLHDASASGAIPQSLHLMGADGGDAPHKIHLRDHDLPALEALTVRIAAAHAAGRPVAVHCVTRESLILTLVALQEAGPHPGDRVEHAAVVPPEVYPLLAEYGVRVVTQPTLLTTRGDDYLRDVEPADRAHLYPYASLLAHGIPVAASSDAPYGDPDPWASIAAASTRSTPSGRVVSPAERVPARVALEGFLSPPDEPGGRVRRVTPGLRADLCLLSVPLAEALAGPTAGHVALVLRNGRVIHPR
ncbi:amidohydrolase family protein [Streptomyces sp. NPDC091271]|uniref:amidohydrolase family protein n=1 Tax=Streptomyces sp. NPDC091271 TaxID=3365980 RepID=UPI00380E9850